MASASRRADITVLSWNINGLKEKFKQQETKTALLEIFDQYDIVLLQETHIGPKKDGKDHDKDWNTINKALSEKYALYKLKVQTMYMTYTTKPLSEKYALYKLLEKEGGWRRRRELEKKRKMYMTYFSSDSKGVAILINKPHTLLKASCEGGDYAWVHVQISGQEYTFVSVYHHKKYQDLICNLMLKIFYSFWTVGLDAVKHRLVIGGDFNTTLDPEQDANKKIKGHAARRDRLKEFMSIVKLSDVWREKHKSDLKPTYTYVDKTAPKIDPESEQKNEPKNDPESKPTMSRLDYVFMLENDVKYVKSCDILSEITLSDHSPVSLTLNYPNTN